MGVDCGAPVAATGQYLEVSADNHGAVDSTQHTLGLELSWDGHLLRSIVDVLSAQSQTA